MADRAVSDLWWKNAVVYCLDVETYTDANGDGVGDFRGLTRRLDYLSRLGITCIWLMPFYPHGGKDDGYDVTDFYDVDPRLGSLGDFVEFVHGARERGIRVIADLVVNHTSRDHPWFRSARSDPDSRFRDWYVWADDRPADEPQPIFPDEEDSSWEWDEEAGRYYLHRFYAEQPDLNVGNPEVVDEIHRIMGFWLQQGISGFRVDAVPYLIEETAIEDQMPEDPHALLEDMRAFATRRRGDAILLGEVNLDPGDRAPFFGDAADEMTGLFHFVMSGAMFLAIAREEAEPLAVHLSETPEAPRDCQWFHFLRNHDELNLSRLSDDEREQVMAAFAPDEAMRIFGRGIRRRLASMLEGDQRRIRLLMSLLFSLPGSPVLWYGQEIGMGEDLQVEGRLSVRTPMQWSDRRNGGFSTADADRLIRPVVADGPYGYRHVNVARQRRDRDSLLNWTEQLIRHRKESPELGWGDASVVEVDDPAVFVLRHEWLDRTTVTVHNLSGREVEVELPAEVFGGTAADDVFGDAEYPRWEAAAASFAVAPYGYRWVRAEDEGPSEEG